MEVQQITINFEAGLAESYPTCREYVASLVHQQSRPQKAIAADMERFIQTTGDTRPIHYPVEKYLTGASPERIAELERELARLRARPRAAA